MSKQTVVETKERFAPGHRACIGCGEALAVRMVCKALGDNVIIAKLFAVQILRVLLKILLSVVFC